MNKKRGLKRKKSEPEPAETLGKLCPQCKTGQDTYQMDPKEMHCPFIRTYKGTSCAYFVSLKEEEKR